MNSFSTIAHLRSFLLSESACCIELEEELSKAKMLIPRIIEKKWRPNSTNICGTEKWNEWIVQIILKLLSHWKPLSCIPANMLTIAESLHPNVHIVQLLSGLSFVRECC